MIAAVLTVATLTLAGTGLLIWATRALKADPTPLVDAIDELLPQSQCAKCGYPGCRPYANAIAAGAPINLCPPGGEPLITSLADLLGRSVTTLDPGLAPETAQVVRIDENRCIGCALCLPACPVDAIVGAPRYLHTVISEACTGCELCLPPCPVDCFTIEPRLHTPAPARPSAGLPCIGCGDCINACPKGLRPDLLHRGTTRGDWAGLIDAGLDACIVCGACNTACPSQLPLAESFRWARTEQRHRRQARHRAQLAKARVEAHEARELARKSAANEQREARRRRIKAHAGHSWSGKA